MKEYNRKEIFKRIKDKESLEGLYLRGVDLSGLDLVGLNLKKASLGGADLEGANLTRADLRGADLWETNLEYANLGLANLEGAYLESATLNEANLSEARLRKANMEEAKLVRANLRDADLYLVNLKRADLREADITGANIWGITCAGWRIDGVKAEYIYNCGTPDNKGAREKSRQNFEPGEFVRLFQSLPTIEMVFAGIIVPQDYAKLMGLVEIIRWQRPEMNLEVKAIEKIGLDTVLRLSLSRDVYLEEAATLIAQLWHESKVAQKLSRLMKEGFGISLDPEYSQPIFNGCDINKVQLHLIDQTGKSLWRGGMEKLAAGVQQKIS